MYIIAGLGNPEIKYNNTRHNIGFRMIDELADRHRISIDTRKHKGLIGKGTIDGEKVVLVKPMTYMNLSGECIREVVSYYKADVTDVIILFDDISLDVGKLRIRQKGSAGGHNGIKSIIACLGSDEFMRVKFGVGDKPRGMDLANYVLGHFTAAENEVINDSVGRACEAVECIVNEGCSVAMNKYNG